MAFFRTVSSSDLMPAITGDGVVLRAPQMSDCAEWAALREASRDFLHAVGADLACRRPADAIVLRRRISAIPKTSAAIWPTLSSFSVRTTMFSWAA